MVVTDVLKGKKSVPDAFNALSAFWRHLTAALLFVVPTVTGAAYVVGGEYRQISLVATAHAEDIKTNADNIRTLKQGYEVVRENQTRVLTTQDFIIDDQEEIKAEVKALRRGLDEQNNKLDLMTSTILDAIRNQQ